MNKTSWLALIVALFIPLVGYLAVKSTSENNAEMPGRYFADTVIASMVKGKEISDTVWHKIPDFRFTNQLGETVTRAKVEGRIFVVNSFFTRCPNICPGLTRNIRKLQASFENPKRKNYGDTPIVKFLSLSVDPERDSVAALKKWADRFNVNSDNWDLLTGPKKEIYDMLLYDFKIGAQDGLGVDSNFIHSEKVMLVDRHLVVRGFYNGLDSLDMGRLAQDIGRLYLEKDKNRPSIFARYKPILPLLIAVPFLVIILIVFLNRKKREEY